MTVQEETQRLYAHYIELEKKADLHGAIETLSQLSSILTTNASIFNKLSILNYRIGDLSLAEKYCRQAITLDINSSAYANTLALILLKKGDLEPAEEALRRSLELDPNNAPAWNNLGIIYKDQNKLLEAEEYLNQALTLSPQFSDALTHLGSVYKLMSKPALACEYHQKALKADPNHLDALFNLGNAQKEDGKFEEAYNSFQSVIDKMPSHIGALTGQSLIELANGNFESGLLKLEHRFYHPTDSQPSLPTEIPYWKGEHLEGKTLLVTWEQGLGDHIQFIRYAELISSRFNPAEILVQTPKLLLNLFCNIQVITTIPHTSTPKNIDYFCPIMSLPRVYGTTSTSIPDNTPYIEIPNNTFENWRDKINDITKPDTLRVGIAWQGDPKLKTDYKRSVSFELLTPILEVENCTFFSLQLGEKCLKQWDDFTNDKQTNLARHITDFVDTAAIIQNLDLIISVDTSIVHLAGTLRRPVWTMISYINDWRWRRKGSTTLWYGSMKLYRQNSTNNWSNVIADIKEDLSNKA